jgi:membrane associated rhomboid family serine protease
MDYEDSYNNEGSTPAVKSLLAINIAVFVAELLRTDFMLTWFALWPDFHGMFTPPFEPWQLVTYSFLHSTTDFFHIIFNMLGLWMFGQTLELTLGTKRFLIYYFVCVLGAALTHLAFAHLVGSYYPVIGASGGIFGLLLAFGMLYPREKMYFMFIPIGIEARFFVVFYGLVELITGITGVIGGVAHFAHLGGMLFGIVMILYWRKKRYI